MNTRTHTHLISRMGNFYAFNQCDCAYGQERSANAYTHSMWTSIGGCGIFLRSHRFIIVQGKCSQAGRPREGAKLPSVCLEEIQNSVLVSSSSPSRALLSHSQEPVYRKSLSFVLCVYFCYECVHIAQSLALEFELISQLHACPSLAMDFCMHPCVFCHTFALTAMKSTCICMYTEKVGESCAC